jgi:hypothetical protein
MFTLNYFAISGITYKFGTSTENVGSIKEIKISTVNSYFTEYALFHEVAALETQSYSTIPTVDQLLYVLHD